MHTNKSAIHTFSKELKLAIGVFLIVMSVGFFSGLTFVENTSGYTSQGVQENYLGNEDSEDVTEMKFKKNEKHMLSIIHSHILSMGSIFFMLAVLLSFTSIHKGFKKFLMVEPMLSVLVTFGGIYFLWKEVLWMKYIVMISGVLMTISFAATVVVIFSQLFKKNDQ